LVQLGVVVVLLLTSACGRIGFSAGTDSGVPATRSELTLSAPTETLVDFPLLVIVDDTRAARDRMQPDASDLRFFDAGGNVLPHEIEQVGAAGGLPLVAWVRVPIIDEPITLTMEYGATPTATSTQPVWSASYAAVYHLSNLRDSTPAANVGVWSGGAEKIAAGRIGDAHVFEESTTDAVVLGGTGALTFPSGITVSAWMQPSSLTSPSGYNAAVTKEYMGAGEVFWLGIEDAPRLGCIEIGTTNGLNAGGSAGIVFTLGSWHHVTLTYDGVLTERIFVDGAVARTTNPGGSLVQATFPIIVGADANAESGPDDDWFDGTIDEVRVETAVRSPGWIAYDVASQRDEVITYGPVGP
jgi:hypothetical protein